MKYFVAHEEGAMRPHVDAPEILLHGAVNGAGAPYFSYSERRCHAGHPGHLGGGIRGASQGVPGASGQF